LMTWIWKEYSLVVGEIRTHDPIDLGERNWMMNLVDMYNHSIMRSLCGSIVCRIFMSRISYVATR
jgi:hypothetical protein